MRRILNLHRKYQTDGACILKHGTNFLMSEEGKRANDLFANKPGSCVTAAHNNESISRCQQGGTMVAAFSRLAGFIQETGVDRTGLGRWSWMKVGTGEHSTRIISAYQPCNMACTSTSDSTGKMQQSKMVWAQRVWYLRKRGIFHNPRKAFRCQLLTQLKHWRAKRTLTYLQTPRQRPGSLQGHMHIFWTWTPTPASCWRKQRMSSVLCRRSS